MFRTALSSVLMLGLGYPQGIHMGPRPFELVEQLRDSPLKRQLQACRESKKNFAPHVFSIGHRGAPMLFPEHTVESYAVAASMGAGIIECDVTFTKDGALVCRHSQCDLHATTNILVGELAERCRQPFVAAEFDPQGHRIRAASALCCTTDITLDEFKRLEGKRDHTNPDARTVEEFLGGTATWRTDQYATGGTLLSHRESIRLLRRFGVEFTPELKAIEKDEKGNPVVENGGFGASGLDRRSLARKLVQEYVQAKIDPSKVHVQSFDLDDILILLEQSPEFGRQAVYLIDEVSGGPLTGTPAEINEDPPLLREFVAVYAQGVRVLAPPMPVLLTSKEGVIRPSKYAKRARQAGFELVSWTTERSGRIDDILSGRGNAFYYQTTLDALHNDGDILTTIHVLAKEVGIKGLFSDWPETTTFYANCVLD